ncbi:LysR family transcriptional regulator substrate-binding protein [Agromyces sp. LHK192]|uniref:LysR family transcriptional regulator substrate-binding protein n=1 Tax=Agromyces sp. LHK192 TaxID=2498704 RepID=UPI000FD8386B|nr:LysR family transcriptional regulator substrate-binding protein [Agromyces sp. LHK192]
MTLRLGYVAGVSPGRWLRAWGERRPDLPLVAERTEQAGQLDGIASGDHDLAFVRLPVDDEGLHAIPLWEEVAVAVLEKEHPLAEAESITLADLDGEPSAPVQAEAAMTVELVAAGTGYAILPHGVARLHHRRDVVAVPIADASPTQVALVWRVERDDDDIQEFVGVVRGRGSRSSRGQASDEPTLSPAKAAKRAAAERRAAEAAKGGGKAGSGKGGGGKGGAKSKDSRPAPRTGRGAKQRNRRRGR